MIANVTVIAIVVIGIVIVIVIVILMRAGVHGSGSPWEARWSVVTRTAISRLPALLFKNVGFMPKLNIPFPAPEPSSTESQ